MEQDKLVGLIQATARGDEAAFQRLYEETAPRLFGFCLRLLKRRDWAEEVMQEFYVKIWHRASDYHAERGAVLTWMYTVLRYQALDRLRAQKPTETLDGNGAESLPQDGPDALGLVLAGDMARHLRGCLEQLSDNHRTSITLAFFEGLTHEQLTERLAVPLGTIKSWIRRGLLSLRRCLEQ